MVLDGIPAATVRALTSRTPASVDEVTDSRRDPLADVRAALETGGFLWARSTETDDPRLAPPSPRLAIELSAMTAQRGEQAAELLASRRHTTVAVQGNSRVGPHVAAILAAAGIGHVYALDLGDTRLHHMQPGGLGPTDEGATFATATAAAVRRVAPEASTTPLRVEQQPDLVIVACDEPVDDDRRAALHARGWAHLPVSVGSAGGVVGPLVIPGLTSCLRCADLHRLDRDPAWTALAVQLATPRRYRDGSAVALSSTIAGVAAMQALAYLDGEDPATIGGTLEIQPGDWRIRRRSWPVHPDCDCISGAGD